MKHGLRALLCAVVAIVAVSLVACSSKKVRPPFPSLNRAPDELMVDQRIYAPRLLPTVLASTHYGLT